jgi:HD-GYP domain-containing protein (c-di-GMP phosphodiesterase class II)
MCNIYDLKKYLGHFTSRNIYDPENNRLLIKFNVEITDKIVSSLRARDLSYIWISKEKTTEEIIEASPEIRVGINKIFKSKKELSQSFKNISNSIMFQAKSKKKNVDIPKDLLEKMDSLIEEMIEMISKNKEASMYLDILNNESPYLLKHSVNISFLTLCMFVHNRKLREIIRCKEKGIGRYLTNQLEKHSDIKNLCMSCLMHDIGKILCFEVINENREFAKEDIAWEKIKLHPRIGHDMLFGKNIDSQVLLGIKYHHENFNGTGYPYGIKGHKIHIYSRIIRIVDSYDAATSVRPGKIVKEPTELLDELKTLSDMHYDREIVDIFIEFINSLKS